VSTAPAKTTTTRRRPTRKTTPASSPNRSAAELNRTVRHTSYPTPSILAAEERAEREGRSFPEVLRAFVKAYGDGRIDV
jgi:hypothetical protein